MNEASDNRVDKWKTVSVKLPPTLHRQFLKFRGDRPDSEALRELIRLGLAQEAPDAPLGVDEEQQVLSRLRRLVEQSPDDQVTMDRLLQIGTALIYDLIGLASDQFWMLEKWAKAGGNLPESLLDPAVIIKALGECRRLVDGLAKHEGLMSKAEVLDRLTRVFSQLGTEVDMTLRMRLGGDQWESVATELKDRLTLKLQEGTQDP